jgi:hypothetical protein
MRYYWMIGIARTLSEKVRELRSEPDIQSTSDIDGWTVDSPIAIEFLERNREYWRSFYELDETGTDGNILIDARSDQFNNVISTLAMGTYVAKVEKLEPIYVLNVDSSQNTNLCKSFGPGRFVPIGLQGYTPQILIGGIKDYLQATVAIDDVDDLIDYSVNGIPIGDLVYSTSKRESGEGTFNEIGRTLKWYLFRALVTVHHYRTVFESHDIRAAIAGHPKYMGGGIIDRMAIQYGGECYHPSTDGFGKYRSISELRKKYLHPPTDVFFDVYDAERNHACRQGSDIVARRLGVHPDDISVQSAETPNDGSRPTAVVFPHIFIEHFRYGNRLYRDFLTWFRETLRIAADMPGIDWKVKPHPHRDAYDMNQDAVAEVSEINRTIDHTIDILSDDTTSEELIRQVDAIVTMDGTAGMEYACYGMPVIVCSETPYSEFGFSIKPENKREYRRILSSLDEIEPLTEAQRERAKVTTYIWFDLIRDHWPDCPTGDGNKWEYADRYLDELQSVEADLYRKTSDLVTSNRRYIRAKK